MMSREHLTFGQALDLLRTAGETLGVSGLLDRAISLVTPLTVLFATHQHHRSLAPRARVADDDRAFKEAACLSTMLAIVRAFSRGQAYPTRAALSHSALEGARANRSLRQVVEDEEHGTAVVPASSTANGGGVG